MGRRGHLVVPTRIMEANGYTTIAKRYDNRQVFKHAHPCTHCVGNGEECELAAPNYGSKSDLGTILVRRCIPCEEAQRPCSSARLTVSLYAVKRKAVPLKDSDGSAKEDGPRSARRERSGTASSEVLSSKSDAEVKGSKRKLNAEDLVAAKRKRVADVPRSNVGRGGTPATPRGGADAAPPDAVKATARPVGRHVPNSSEPVVIAAPVGPGLPPNDTPSNSSAQRRLDDTTSAPVLPPRNLEETGNVVAEHEDPWLLTTYKHPESALDEFRHVTVTKSTPGSGQHLLVEVGDVVALIVPYGADTLVMNEQGGVGLVPSDHISFATSSSPLPIGPVTSHAELRAVCASRGVMAMVDEAHIRLDMELAEAADLRDKIPHMEWRLERMDSHIDYERSQLLREIMEQDEGAVVKRREAVQKLKLFAALQERAAEEAKRRVKREALEAARKGAEEMDREIRGLQGVLERVYGQRFAWDEWT